MTNNHHTAEIAELLDALNNANPATVWDDVIYPRLTPTEHNQITTDMIRRGTFIHHHIPYGRAYYSGTWTTLLTAADLDPSNLDPVDQSALSPDTDAARQTSHTGAVSTGVPVCPQATKLSG